MDVLPVFMIRSTSVPDMFPVTACWASWELPPETVAEAAFAGEIEPAGVVVAVQAGEDSGVRLWLSLNLHDGRALPKLFTSGSMRRYATQKHTVMMTAGTSRLFL